MIYCAFINIYNAIQSDCIYSITSICRRETVSIGIRVADTTNIEVAEPNATVLGSFIILMHRDHFVGSMDIEQSFSRSVQWDSFSSSEESAIPKVFVISFGTTIYSVTFNPLSAHLDFRSYSSGYWSISQNSAQPCFLSETVSERFCVGEKLDFNGIQMVQINF
jgi:hypothetical protein